MKINIGLLLFGAILSFAISNAEEKHDGDSLNGHVMSYPCAQVATGDVEDPCNKQSALFKSVLGEPTEDGVDRASAINSANDAGGVDHASAIDSTNDFEGDADDVTAPEHAAPENDDSTVINTDNTSIFTDATASVKDDVTTAAATDSIGGIDTIDGATGDTDNITTDAQGAHDTGVDDTATRGVPPAPVSPSRSQPSILRSEGFGGQAHAHEDVIGASAAEPSSSEDTKTDSSATERRGAGVDASGNSFESSGEDTSDDRGQIAYDHGCFALENDKAAFQKFQEIVPGMTATYCLRKCSNQGYQNFVLAQGSYCLCVDDPEVSLFFVDRSPGICDAPCPGDPSQHCGGADAYDVYSGMVDHEDEYTFHGWNSAPPDEDDTSKPGFVLHKARVYAKKFWGMWSLAELSLVNGSGLKLCDVKNGKATSSCQDLAIDGSSEIVALERQKKGNKKTGGERFPVRVTTGAPRGRTNPTWVLDMQTREELEEMVAFVDDAIFRSIEVEDSDMHANIARTPQAKHPNNLAFGDGIEPIPAFCGSILSPMDRPMTAGRFLSTLPILASTNLAITEVGDVLLRRGDLPAYSEPDLPVHAAPEGPLWAHRATGSIGGKANGGLGCVVESWWSKAVRGKADDTPVHLSVKNGRWRIGRGRLCTMGKSPKPTGSWRTKLPWDARGKAIKDASLQLLDSGNLVVASGDDIFWDSSSPS